MHKRTVPFAYLVEQETDAGERTLTGRFGAALIVGRIIGTTEDGLLRWALAVTEDDRTAQRREQYRKRKRGEASPDD